MKWWMTGKVQFAKNTFLNAICNYNNNVEEDLANLINTLRKL